MAQDATNERLNTSPTSTSVVGAYLKELSNLKNYIITIPLLLCGSYLFYNMASGETVILWGKEDSFFEWLTALFYFTAGVLLILTFKQNKNVYLVLLACVLLFGAGEEMSWGQRIFGFATPEEINKINVQHEFNIHNMVIFDGKKMEGGPKQGLERFLEMDMLFKLFTIFWGFVLPLCVYHLSYVVKLTRKFKIPVPPVTVGVFFLISWFCLKYSLAAVPKEEDMSHYWRVYMAGPEIAESISGFILAIVSLYFYNNRKKPIMGYDYKQLPA